jgi:hypothetical protein
MHHVEAMVSQIAQKRRQHGRGSRLGIVKQDDTPAGGIEAVDESS